MELYQLRYFKAVADCQNITEASRRLHVSQPSLSRSIKHLETEMGVELFDRVGRRIVLNDKGEVFLGAVVRALDSVDSVGHTLDRYVREKKQTLNVRAPVPFGDDLRVIGGFRALHPEIVVRYGADPTPYLDSEIPDLTFLSSFTEHNEPNYLKLGTEELVLSVPRDHPLASLREVRLADLADEQFVSVLPCAIRVVIDAMFMEAGFEPRMSIEDQHCWSVNRYVAKGFGVAIAPSITWFSDEDRAALRQVPFSDVRRERSLYLKWSANVPLPPAAELFRDYLVECFNELYARIEKDR